jgi:hypothetical protein
MEILEEERKKIVQNIAKLDIDISVLERTDPELTVAREKLSEKSYREIKAKTMLENYRKEKEGSELRLRAVETLIKAL